MRWLFLTLLILNALYFVWHQQQPSEHVQQLPPVFNPAGVKSIEIAPVVSAVPDNVTPVADHPASTLLIGGFDEYAQIQSLQQRLLSLDIDVQEISVEELDRQDFWVYLPPLVSRTAAMRQIKELKARNIESYLISQGDMLNGISLGMFTDRQGADELTAKLQSLGYRPAIKAIARSQKTYWLAVKQNSERLIDESLMGELLVDFPQTRYRQEADTTVILEK